MVTGVNCKINGGTWATPLMGREQPSWDHAPHKPADPAAYTSVPFPGAAPAEWWEVTSPSRGCLALRHCHGTPPPLLSPRVTCMPPEQKGRCSISHSYELRHSSLSICLVSGKEPAWNAEDLGSIPGSGRSPGEGNGNPLQCFAWRIPWMESYSSLGCKESDMTEQLTLSFSGDQREATFSHLTCKCHQEPLLGCHFWDNLSEVGFTTDLLSSS